MSEKIEIYSQQGRFYNFWSCYEEQNARKVHDVSVETEF